MSENAARGEYRPPCEAVGHMGESANYDGLERRVCPTCRLYFDTGEDSDTVFCGTSCRRRYEDGLRADGGTDKALEEVYQDRNLLACALAEATGAPSGWKPDPESPDEWAIVWIQTPMGQVSWHVPRAMVGTDQLGLHPRDSEYDGYTREEKNDRLAAWAKRGCPY
ncbi:hypothetical protein [Natronosalvus amylolyticus]|uniref:WDGH domain-containing protein n=1 Tax=Natronosalvus amylolyticus TaxID=2961994 RepID=UPI0020CA1CC2|nr:hypothetical protein [Natronosalvus amylolyticus]